MMPTSLVAWEMSHEWGKSIISQEELATYGSTRVIIGDAISCSSARLAGLARGIDCRGRCEEGGKDEGV